MKKHQKQSKKKPLHHSTTT